MFHSVLFSCFHLRRLRYLLDTHLIHQYLLSTLFSLLSPGVLGGPRRPALSWHADVHEIFSGTHKVGAAFDTVSAKFHAETHGPDQPIALGLCQASADRRRWWSTKPELSKGQSGRGGTGIGNGLCTAGRHGQKQPHERGKQTRRGLGACGSSKWPAVHV